MPHPRTSKAQRKMDATERKLELANEKDARSIESAANRIYNRSAKGAKMNR